MTARKPAAASRSRTTTPTLEERVAALEAKVDNLAKFIAAGIARQVQAQLLGNPEIAAQLMAAQNADQG